MNSKIIKTSDDAAIKEFIKALYIPPSQSHKGENGKLLIIGGSKLFHASPIWSAEVASHFCDMVHFASTKENNDIYTSLKKNFTNGIIVPQREIENYAKEDNVVLIGPGMVRGEIPNDEEVRFKDILNIKNESDFTYYMSRYLLNTYPEKKFVLDAGALQMINPKWLLHLNTKAIVTPHQKEFKTLFGIDLESQSVEKKVQVVNAVAKQYNVVILLKAVIDIITDGSETCIIDGGNSGLTKGGSGDILAGLTAALYTKNDSLFAAIAASLLVKKTADTLFEVKGYWYNMNELIENIPIILKKLLYN